MGNFEVFLINHAACSARSPSSSDLFNNFDLERKFPEVRPRLEEEGRPPHDRHPDEKGDYAARRGDMLSPPRSVYRVPQ